MKLFRSLMAVAAVAAVAAATVVAAPASASETINWSQGSDGDVWGQAFTGVIADTLTWGGTDSSYEVGITGPMAHSHGQDMIWTINATVDGMSKTIFQQFLSGNGQQSLVDLGGIHFTKGTVTEIDLGCDSCSGNTFHQFSDATMTLSAGVPEPAGWAMMLLGFGGLGAMLRRRGQSAHAA